MSKIKNDGLDQYCAEPFEQQQFGTAGVEAVKPYSLTLSETPVSVSARTDLLDINTVVRSRRPHTLLRHMRHLPARAPADNTLSELQ